MTKSDLKSGMLIETRGEKRYILVEFENEGLCAMSISSYFPLSDIDEDMNCRCSSLLDIMKVYVAQMRSLSGLIQWPGKLLWQRDDTKEITASEAFRILKKYYGCDVKIMEE